MRTLHSLSVWRAAVLAGVCIGGAHAQQNLGFEASAADGGGARGWTDAGPADGIRDFAVARSGRSSWRIEAGGDRRGNRIGQVVAAAPFAGERLRIHAYARTDAQAVPSVWVRVDAEASLIYVDTVTAVAPREAHGRGTQWRHLSVDAPVSTHAVRISFGGGARGTGNVWFDDFRVEIVDAAAATPPSSTARAYLERALDLMQSHSINKQRLDWHALRGDAFRMARGARTIEDAHLAVRFALGELGDRHSYFMTSRQMGTLSATPVSNARTGRAPVPPSGAALGGSVGLIRIPGFAGGDQHAQVEFAEQLHEIARRLQPAAACGWIVDLRDNSGGNLWPMLAGIGPLLGDGEAVAAVYPDGERQSLWYANGKVGLGDYVQLRVNTPFEASSTDAPIAVLTDRSTASSAEILIAALRAREHTRTFGAATRGVSTGTRTMPLSDGSAMILTVSATSDPKGRIYDGPIEPDVTIGSGARAVTRERLDTQAEVNAARRWLEEQCVRR